jgi:hypothetical protein
MDVDIFVIKWYYMRKIIIKRARSRTPIFRFLFVPNKGIVSCGVKIHKF